MSRLLLHIGSSGRRGHRPICRLGTEGTRALSSLENYERTLNNLLIGEHTRVIFQGFTGRQATANAIESIAWGTKIVGGVTPGRTGEHLGLPVLPTVRKAVDELRPDATGIYVAAHQAPSAIIEAIEAEVPLIVAVAEHIPLHDILQIHSVLKTQDKSRLVGANSPGIISAVGKCRIGFQPLPCFTPGRIGIIAKSGTLSYEAVASTTRAGLGQTLCIGVGGDMIPGTDIREALTALELEPNTDGIALIGEIGGAGEIEAVEWIREYNTRITNPKPIVALIGGINEIAGKVMGHAGAFRTDWEPDAQSKVSALRDAGVTVISHPAKFGKAFVDRLGQTTPMGRIPDWISSGFSMFSKKNPKVGQSRQMHASASARSTAPQCTWPRPEGLGSKVRSKRVVHQRRHFSISQEDAFSILRQTGKISCASYSGHGERHYLAIGIDRHSRRPCVVAAPTVDPELIPSTARIWPFTYQSGPGSAVSIRDIGAHLGLKPSQDTESTLARLVDVLSTTFYEKEAYLLATHIVTCLGEVKVVGARFGFDSAAFRSAGRVADVHQAMRDRSQGQEDAEEREAERHGIVYLKFPGEDASIGTLVNGAGLAMNTVDALQEVGGRAANFLDTGGKATSETVKTSFEIILTDPRVKVVFVNIFGGLTLGDMIARGVILTFKELAPSVPVVVRIRGTNEEEGQKIIQESGLPLLAYDDFDEAAKKVVELSRL